MSGLSSLIKSTLVKADLSELDKQLENDEELNKLLKAKGNDIPKRYLYLLSEVIPNWDKYSLYDLIRLSEDSLGSDKVYFSKAGNKIVGWAAYQVTYDITNEFNYVSELKVFSFDINRPNPVLFRDLDTLLKDLMRKYPVVSWEAVSENPANAIYKKVANYYGGIIQNIDDGHIRYILYDKRLEAPKEE